MLSRRSLLSLASGGAAAALLPQMARAASAWAPYPQAIVIDALSGLPGSDDPYDGVSFAPIGPRSLAALRASGVTACSQTVGGGDSPLDDVVKDIAWCTEQIAEHPEALLLVRRGADIDAAKASQRLGVIFNVQGLAPIGRELERLNELHGLGLRVAQLTYNNRNLAGDGCLEPADGGLSRFGRGAVERLNGLRMLIDGAHAGAQVIKEAALVSKAPIAVTHTGCAELNPNPRNISDATMRAVADRGGVVGIYFMPFLRASGQQMAADVVRHLEHAVEIAGEEHVGIGTDGDLIPTVLDEKFKKEFVEFVRKRKKDGISAPGESEDVFNLALDLNGPAKLDTLAAALVARGHKDARIAKILGGNFARLFRDVCG